MMMSQAFQKRGEPVFALRGRLRWVAFCLFLLAFVWVCSAPASAAGEETASAAQAAPCKGLKPFNNLDELLYQFYVNLDSDCLFDMPVEELEKVWNIKILTDEKQENQDYNRYDFFEKPYMTEKDAFYIRLKSGALAASQMNDSRKKKSQYVRFTIATTKENRERYGSLFPQHNFPKLIPPPLLQRHGLRPYYGTGIVRYKIDGKDVPLARLDATEPKGDYNFAYVFYYWFNSDLSSMIWMDSENAIKIVNFVSPGLKLKFAL